VNVFWSSSDMEDVDMRVCLLQKGECTAEFNYNWGPGDFYMRKCSGNNTQEWGLDAIFDVKCTACEHMNEFFKDEITRRCFACQKIVSNDRKDYGCGQWCSSSSTHMRNFCPKFKRSKDRFHGHICS